MFACCSMASFQIGLQTSNFKGQVSGLWRQPRLRGTPFDHAKTHHVVVVPIRFYFFSGPWPNIDMFAKLFTATRLQAATYLLGVCMFSISFLVFINSSVSFVITDLIGQRSRVGDAVGTLGFADELMVLVACPAWGMLSDRLGIRMVSSDTTHSVPAHLTVAGLRFGLYYHRSCASTLCPSQECGSPVATRQTVLQYWRCGDFDYGYSNSPFYGLFQRNR